MPDPITEQTIQWSLLIDGSALFFGKRAVSPDRPLNYDALKNVLQARFSKDYLKDIDKIYVPGFKREREPSMPLVGFPRPAFFFTAVDEANEKKQKFHQSLSNLGWTVHELPLDEASIANPLLSAEAFRYIRFDAMIACCLGSLVHDKNTQHIVVVSDSWSLAGPVKYCLMKEKAVTMAFFGQVMDPRWQRLFRGMKSLGMNLSFLDLDFFAGSLYGKVLADSWNEFDMLRSLP